MTTGLGWKILNGRTRKQLPTRHHKVQYSTRRTWSRSHKYVWIQHSPFIWKLTPCRPPRINSSNVAKKCLRRLEEQRLNPWLRLQFFRLAVPSRELFSSPRGSMLPTFCVQMQSHAEFQSLLFWSLCPTTTVEEMKKSENNRNWKFRSSAPTPSHPRTYYRAARVVLFLPNALVDKRRPRLSANRIKCHPKNE